MRIHDVVYFCAGVLMLLAAAFMPIVAAYVEMIVPWLAPTTRQDGSQMMCFPLILTTLVLSMVLLVGGIFSVAAAVVKDD